MNDRIRKNMSTWFFRIQVIAAVLAMVVALAFAVVSTPPVGTILTDSYLSALRFYEISQSGFVAFTALFSILLGSCFATAYFGKNIVPCCIIGIAIVVSLFLFRGAFACVFHKPRIETAICVKRDVHVSSQDSGAEVHTYVLYFDNGTSVHVPEKTWSNSVDKKFYLVMCGGYVLDAYKTSEYLLPGETR